MEQSGYNEFYDTVDGLVMGPKTYDMIREFGKWPYGDKPTWICSSGTIELMEGMNLQIEIGPTEVTKTAKASGVEHLWLVGGGSLACAFAE